MDSELSILESHAKFGRERAAFFSKLAKRRIPEADGYREEAEEWLKFAEEREAMVASHGRESEDRA
jgi:hypothetical protein